MLAGAQMLHAHHSEPQHDNLCIVALPQGREAGKGGACEMEGGGGAKRGDGLILDVLDEPEGSWGKAAVAVDGEG